MSVQPPQTAPQLSAQQAALLAEYERQRLVQARADQQFTEQYVALFTAVLTTGATAQAISDFLSLLAALATGFSDLSSRLFSAGYSSIRSASGIRDAEPFLDFPRMNVQQLWTGQRVTALRRLGAGQPVSSAAASGAGSARRVLNQPYRQTMHDLVNLGAQARGADPIRPQTPTLQQPDPQLIGYMRVTDGDPCFFCAMLASRGPVYATAQSAQYREDGQTYHDLCACVPVPVFSGGPPQPAVNVLARQMWESSTEGLSGTDARSAFRRAWESRNAA